MFVGCGMLMSLSNSVLPSPPVSSLLTGLARYYPLEGDATDVYGSQNGTVTGSGFETGKDGQGFYFANTTSRAIVCPAFDPVDFSVSFWTKFSGSGNYSQVVGQMDGGYGSQNWVILASSNTLTYYKYGNAGILGLDLTSQLGVWAHVVYTRSGSDVRGYLNGTMTGPVGSAAGTLVPTANFRMGTRNDNYSGYFGVLDEVALWTRALTDSEVSQLYNSGSGNFYPFT